MKQFVLVIFLMAAYSIYPTHANAISMPCGLILEPVDNKLINAKGAALMYKVQLPPSKISRTNISILAVHIPEPSSYGNYDSYEGYASIPEEISWRFRLYPTRETDSPTWAGRFDFISAEMKNADIQVRPSNSNTQTLGPAIITNNIVNCK